VITVTRYTAGERMQCVESKKSCVGVWVGGWWGCRGRGRVCCSTRGYTEIIGVGWCRCRSRVVLVGEVIWYIVPSWQEALLLHKKHRRLIKNRESAQLSRMRKKVCLSVSVSVAASVLVSVSVSVAVCLCLLSLALSMPLPLPLPLPLSRCLRVSLSRCLVVTLSLSSCVFVCL
jgi:hypothetical protein